MNTEILGLKIPPSDLCHVQWRSLAWVLENGPITALNVMDYFSLSPFYDRHSTNQVLKMQSMFSGQPQMSPEEEKEALRKLVGIEFEVILSRPEQDREGGLFVIEKRERKSYDEYYPIAAYYVLRTSIYQSPSIHSTLSARVLSSLSTLSELLNLARSHKPTYDPCHGYAWKIKERSKGDNQEKDFDKKKKFKENESVEHRVDTSERTGTETEPMDIDDDEKLIGSSKISKINSTVKSSNPNVDPPTVSNTTEIFNPILFRALQTTTSNFPAFRIDQINPTLQNSSDQNQSSDPKTDVIVDNNNNNNNNNNNQIHQGLTTVTDRVDLTSSNSTNQSMKGSLEVDLNLNPNETNSKSNIGGSNRSTLVSGKRKLKRMN